MEQNKNREEIEQAEADRMTIVYLLGLCKETHSVATCKRTYYDGYEVAITARKQGAVAADEFTIEQFEVIKAMAENKMLMARVKIAKEFFQKIIDKCNLNLANLRRDDADE